MEIKSANFIKGIRGSDDILNDLRPQIAFIGRSNVGKSSVINSLVGTKKALVKSSSLPGKTREINFFLINNDLFFVDLPGYGFAKIKSVEKEKLRKLILWYLLSEEVKPKRKIVLIIDFKVGPSEFDLEMINLLKENNFDFIITANKIDKISKGARLKQLKEISRKLGTENIVLFSAKTGDGKDELFEKLKIKN
ncbi:TPA: YihA family ribosome biogenesis GTP-binding protein [Candidatus Campbellbacteria bacterium]|jgi:GTP-binding protein|nr:MAG: GTP-binding protein, GTP-binding protein [Candidatus Campbellbacteria bacterium GW2011_OD1_34_28]KKP74779.1 MAG: putative GTP-binding protein EngB [Candidatus Campbellbacteria bacterium GW2011_GWD2_35_24]KKP75665.1 MAG: GTP-binding protein, GTP-binding protein [Candidatus Campbellbacteria bacterium GW2011_GWC2_35_28]KKP77087.1 MAG: engB, yihA, ribosome biogenesis GTP-binding protein YsxC, GTP-binding protein [Candidatus Campbellbacteria bacterium GW2011_GWC1_35_31]KKP79013.1 MAG: putati